MPSGRKICESVAMHLRKAPLYRMREVSILVGIEFFSGAVFSCTAMGIALGRSCGAGSFSEPARSS